MPGPAPLTEADLERLRTTDAWTARGDETGLRWEIGVRPDAAWMLVDFGGTVEGFLIREDLAYLRGSMWHMTLPASTRPEDPDSWVATPARSFRRGGLDHDALPQIEKLVGDVVTIVWDDDAPPPSTPVDATSAEDVGLQLDVTGPATIELREPDEDGEQWHVGSEDLIRSWGLADCFEADLVARRLLAEGAPHLLEQVEFDSYEDVFSAYATSAEAALTLVSLLQGDPGHLTV